MSGRWSRWRQRRRAAAEEARKPTPPCGHKGWRYWQVCDLPVGHGGEYHGTITSRTTRRGGLVESESVTREMWT